MSNEEIKKPDTFRECKKCKKLVVRNPAGKFPSGRDTKYVNDKDRQWSGLECPTCVKERMGKHMKAKRNKDLQ